MYLTARRIESLLTRGLPGDILATMPLIIPIRDRRSICSSGDYLHNGIQVEWERDS